MSALSELHMSRVRRLCCVACLILGQPTAGGVVQVPLRDLPVCEEVHHIEHDRHKFSDFLVLPLCWEHHNGFTGIHGRHRLGFEKLHGITQWQLLGVVTSLLLADRAALVGG